MKRTWLSIATLGACLAATTSLPAQDTGAITSGNWNIPAIWTARTVPGSGNTVYIGNNYPAGSATSATVFLTQNEQAGPIYLGYSAGSSGTLNLANFNINATSFNIGNGGGTGTVLRGTGAVQVGGLNIYSGNSFNFTSSDIVTGLGLSGNAIASTISAGNITGNVLATSGSTLTLGSSLTVSGDIDLRNTSTVLNAQGHNISASTFFLGTYGAGATLVNRGNLTLSNALYLNDQSFQLTPSDSVAGLVLSNGSTALGAGVTIGRIILVNNATAATVESGNITGNISLTSGSLLTLGSNITNPSAVLDLRDSGTTLNAQGHNITASEFYLGFYGSGATLINRGNINAGTFIVAGQSINITPSDTIGNYGIKDASSTILPGASLPRLVLYQNAQVNTTTSSSLTGNVYIANNSTLTLGANLQITGQLSLSGLGATVNAQGNNIAAIELDLGVSSAGGSLLNDGAVSVYYLYLNNSNSTSLHHGNDSSTILQLASGSQLHITDSPGQSTGYTILGLTASYVNIDATSKLILDINGLAFDWILRWANPLVGDHIADLTSLISLGHIELNNPGNYSYEIYSSPDGFTYIANAVPEPGSILLAGTVGAASLAYARFRRSSAKWSNEPGTCRS